MQCGFCQNRDLKEVYKPKGSRIALTILLCQNCGLVQSSWEKRKTPTVDLSTNEYPEIKKLSCDADYSEVRVGKGQMTSEAISILEKNLGDEEIKEVLDICSARGHFAMVALERFNLSSIDCVDPDKYMTITYANDPRINLIIGKYDSLKTDKKYDLIYSCHTLEHYREPAKKIDFMIERLRRGGYLLLDVPNLENVCDVSVVDDFFYDHHKYYFSRGILKNFLISRGLELVAENNSLYSIILLMRKSGTVGAFESDHSYAKTNERLIKAYSANLEANRKKIPEVVWKIEKIANGKRNAVLGCGRILDALIVYGGLNLDNFDILIDNFLINTTSVLYGRKVYRSSILDTEQADNIFLMTRSATSGLITELSKKYPKMNVVQVSSLFDFTE